MTNEASDLPKGRKAALKRIAWGVLALALGLGLWESYVGNPYHDLLLAQYAQTVSGHVTDSWEEAGSGDEGGTQWFCNVTYEFQLHDGREYTASSGDRPGRLSPEFSCIEEPVPVVVEYFPPDPTISRIEGDGSESLLEWFWREFLIGGLMLVVFCLPGLYLLRDGIRGLRLAGSKGPPSSF